MQLSYVIPCLNEEETIGIVVKKAIKFLEANHIDGEVVVSDNGSTDRSKSIAEALGARVVDCPKRGNGNALRLGFQAAKGKYIVMLDADDSYDAGEIKPLLNELEKGAELVIGSRLRGHMEPGSNPWLHRYIGTPLQTWICNLFFGTKISDVHSGMRAFRSDILGRLKLESKGFELCTEMMIKAGITKTRIKEIPINFYKDKRSRKPHLKTWSHGWAVLKYMLLFASNKLLTIPGIIFFALGTLLIFSQASGPLYVGAFRADIHFMVLGLMLSIIGIYMTTNGILINLYSNMRYYFHEQTRASRFIERAFTFNKGFIVGTISSLIGVAIEISILVEWIRMNYTGISAIRPVIMGFYFIFCGLAILIFSFIFTVFQDSRTQVKE